MLITTVRRPNWNLLPLCNYVYWSFLGRMGMAATLKLIYKENGIVRGLYRGMSINYMRAIPMVAVSFSTYEVTKQLLGLDTGLSIKAG